IYRPEPGQRPGGMGTVLFVAYCPGNAELVLAKCKSVLEIALRLSSEGKFDEKVWESSLPDWFVKRCAKELSSQELEKRLQLPLEERIRLEEQEGWSLKASVYWFKPEERYWSWWDAVVTDANTIIVAAQVKDWPFPWGALRWLLRASGAERVEANE